MQNTQFETPSTTWSGLGRLLEGPVGWLITLILIGVLLAAALLLPPVNLLERLGGLATTRIPAGIGGSVRDPDGTLLNFPGEGVQSAFSASLESTPRADFIEGRGGQDIYTAASTLPNFLVPKSPLYHTTVSGQAPDTTIVSIPIPNDSLPYETLDLYMWTGQSWEHLPNEVLATSDVVEARLNFVPEYFMIMQTSGAGNIPEATATLEFNSQLPDGAVVANEMVSGLRLRGDGALDGDAPYNNDGRTIPIIRNWEGDSWAPTVRTDLINNLLIDIGQQENQLNAVEQTILLNSYPGVVIDYRGVDALPSAKADFVYLMKRLADRLHASGKKLYVRVEAPSPISAETWDTGGHDWRALGAVADTIIVPAPIDPLAYQPNGAMDALLKFAAGEIDRRKIQIELPGQSIERAGQYLLPKGYQQAFQPLLQKIDAQSDSNGELMLTLQNPSVQGQVTLDTTLGMYTYNYEDAQNLTRTVYIESASSIANKLNLLAKYNIRKVTLDTPVNGDVDPMIWDVLLKFQQGQEINVEQSKLDVVYSLYNQSGALVAQQLSPIESPSVAIASPGGENLQVEATIVDNGRAVAPALSHTIGAAVAAAKAATTGEVAVQAADVAAADDAAVAVEVAEVGPSSPAVSVSQILNVREGPGTVYNILGQVNPGNNFPIAGKNDAGDWWEIEYAPGQTGWVFGQLVDASGDVGGVVLLTFLEAPVWLHWLRRQRPARWLSKPHLLRGQCTGFCGGPGFGYAACVAHMVGAWATKARLRMV
ncbi:MAG: SH3 domain-containing protein [Caldilineaceae bacterium]|nr:SH3 domain-containing protein [Caldilineaceae bacterium]